MLLVDDDKGSAEANPVKQILYIVIVHAYTAARNSAAD